MGLGFRELVLQEERMADLEGGLGKIGLQAQGGPSFRQAFFDLSVTDQQTGHIVMRRNEVGVQPQRFPVLSNGRLLLSQGSQGNAMIVTRGGVMRSRPLNNT